MATRRRIGVSAATTEAARRQLMQPVPCWEQRWTYSDPTSGTTSFKILKWVRTDKIQVSEYPGSFPSSCRSLCHPTRAFVREQQFSDEEGEADEPLAPLPDEPEVVDGDEEGEDDAIGAGADGAVLQVDGSEAPTLSKDQQDLLSKPPSPKVGPQLSMSVAGDEEQANNDDNGALDVSLNPFDGPMDDVEKLSGDGMMELDMSSLAAPDGSDFVGTLDEILGGSMMDPAGDPFAQPEDQ